MRNLSLGDAGPDVSKLQRHLKTLEMYDGPVDGVFGEGTQQAVIEFQKVFLVTGWVDSGTEELIVRKQAESLTPYPNPDPDPEPDPDDERPGGFNSSHIIWSDEFPEDGFPDKMKWESDATKFGNTSNENQVYVEDQAHQFVEDGELVIRAQRSSYGYSSGQLISSASWAPPRDGSKAYRMEAMMKLASGQGVWSAFRLFGNEDTQLGRWPRSGEIEVVGYSSGPPYYGSVRGFQGAAHTGYSQPAFTGSASPDDPRNMYHLYSVNLYNDRIEWYVNYRKVFVFTRPDQYEPAINWPFHNDEGNSFSILLSVALGGRRAGRFDLRALPTDMRVKYVRVYEK